MILRSLGYAVRSITANSQIHATKVLQKQYETFIHRNL